MVVLTVSAVTPGCNTFYNTFTTPHTVDNFNNSYLIEVILSTNTTATTFSAVRIYYQLQVSPAPVTASFTDVPTTHPYFRFIEAMVASGITGGCGSGNYCPDASLTRGQMAVFLSTALGLHWPN